MTGPDGNSLVPTGETYATNQMNIRITLPFEDNALEERAERALALYTISMEGLKRTKEAHPAWLSLALWKISSRIELCDQMLDRKNNSMFATLSMLTIQRSC